MSQQACEGIATFGSVSVVVEINRGSAEAVAQMKAKLIRCAKRRANHPASESALTNRSRNTSANSFPSVVVFPNVGDLPFGKSYRIVLEKWGAALHAEMATTIQGGKEYLHVVVSSGFHIEADQFPCERDAQLAIVTIAYRTAVVGRKRTSSFQFEEGDAGGWIFYLSEGIQPKPQYIEVGSHMKHDGPVKSLLAVPIAPEGVIILSVGNDDCLVILTAGVNGRAWVKVVLKIDMVPQLVPVEVLSINEIVLANATYEALKDQPHQQMVGRILRELKDRNNRVVANEVVAADWYHVGAVFRGVLKENSERLEHMTPSYREGRKATRFSLVSTGANRLVLAQVVNDDQSTPFHIGLVPFKYPAEFQVFFLGSRGEVELIFRGKMPCQELYTAELFSTEEDDVSLGLPTSSAHVRAHTLLLKAGGLFSFKVFAVCFDGTHAITSLTCGRSSCNGVQEID